MSTAPDSRPLTIDTGRVHWYRCPIEPATLRELTERSDVRGGIQALGHLAVAGGTGALTVYCFLAELWVAFALALFAHGAEDPGYQFDTPVPAPSGSASSTINPEAAAIGDIAPRELRAAA